MPKYHVQGLVDATVWADNVIANSPEEAANIASFPSHTVCHQCSDHLEVGDVYELRVFDEKHTTELWNDRDEQSEVDAKALAEFLKDKKRLPANIKAIVERWAT